MKEHIIRAILYQDMSVKWKDAELNGDVNVHLNVHQKTRQFVEVELGDFLLNDGEWILASFEKTIEGDIHHENPSGMDKVEGQQGVFRLQLPTIVHNTPGEWGVQFLLVTDYNPATGDYTTAYPFDIAKFCERSSFLDDGLTIPGKDNLSALHAEAVQKIQAESKNAENITALQTGLSATNEKVQENEIDINGIRASVSFTLGKSIGLTLDDEYKLTAYLYNGAGSVISKQTVDFPVESMIVDIDVDEATKSLILTLQNGNSVSVPVGDIVEGLISSTEKGQPNGVATLGADGKVPSEQLPAGQGGAPDLTEYVKFTDKIATNKFGVAATDSKYGVTQYNGVLATQPATEGQIDQQAQLYTPIVPARLSRAVKVGITTNTETLTDEDKTEACDWLGALKAQNPEFTDGGATRGYVYFIDAKGNQVVKAVQIQANYDTIPLRNPNGNFYVNTPTLPYECTPKGYVDDLPDNLTLTDDTQEDGTVTEGTKTKWQKWLGIESGAGGGTKLYRHIYTSEFETTVYIITTRATRYTTANEVRNDFINCKIIKAFDTTVGYSATIINVTQGTNNMQLPSPDGSTVGAGIDISTASVVIEEL